MKPTKKEFLEKYYPIPAEKMKDKSWEECLKHSIRKWWGMRHKISGDHFGSMTHSDTCALCIKSTNEAGGIDCRKCPLAQYDIRCVDVGSGWLKSINDRKGYPIIKDLIQALREVKENPERWEG